MDFPRPTFAAFRFPSCLHRARKLLAGHPFIMDDDLARGDRMVRGSSCTHRGAVRNSSPDFEERPQEGGAARTLKDVENFLVAFERGNEIGARQLGASPS